MQPFRVMRSMSKRDRTTLGGIVLAMIVGVGGSLGLAASCLGRDRAHRADDPISAFPEDRSARTSSGGVPGEEAVGETQITQAELPAGAPAAPPAPENAPPPNPNPTPAAGMTTQPHAPPAPQAHATVNVHVAGDQVQTTTSSSADAGGGGAGASPIAAPAGDALDGGAGTTPGTTGTTGGDAGAGAATTGDGGAATAAPAASPPPAPRFLTEPPQFGASSWVPNHEAGAGPFTTERNVPSQPGP